jgi:hypothetical protein
MYVLEGDTDDPMLPFKFIGKVSTSDDHWAIDGTVLKDVRAFLFSTIRLRYSDAPEHSTITRIISSGLAGRIHLPVILSIYISRKWMVQPS